jgi:exosortase
MVTLRNTLFISFTIIVLIIFYAPLRDLIAMSLQYNELYSHIILIPLISGYFVYMRRKSIFTDMNYACLPGITLITIGAILYLLGKSQGIKLNQNDYLSLMTFSAVITLIGGFVFFYGSQAVRVAAFPLLFIFFMVPIPSLVLEKVILALQRGSADVSYSLFKLTGIPLVREGSIFYLPGISIEVAEQCSGIRSSIAFFITGILAGHLFLTRGWRKIILLSSIIPITIIKNGVRIVTLSLLALYVDDTILKSSLHMKGGILFFLIALIPFVTLLWLLRQSEKKGIHSETNS